MAQGMLAMLEANPKWDGTGSLLQTNDDNDAEKE
jgi:hypothetical protein